MNRTGIILTVLMSFFLIFCSVPSHAVELIASPPMQLYYTTNGADPVLNSTSVLGTGSISNLSATLNSAISDGFYSLASAEYTWTGTDADRLKASTADYTSIYGDESSVVYTLPWTFSFYGQTYSQITVDTNGNIWFGSAQPAHSFSLASPGQVPVIALWNNDLSSYAYDGVYIQHKTDSERVVIEWQTETFTDEGNSLPNNFEAVLFPNGDIRIDYKSFTTENSDDFGSGISKGDNTKYLDITSNAGPVYTLTSSSYLITAVDLNLNVVFSGTGSGYVTSSPSGIGCNANCGTQFKAGTPVTLHPETSQYSIFTGWKNGVCSGTADCLLTLIADSSVTAQFDYDAAHQVQVNTGGGSNYYSSLQAAYNAASAGSTIKLWATEYTESLNCSRSVSVTMKGGYDSDYSSIVGETLMNGTLTISNGAVVVDGFTVK